MGEGAAYLFIEAAGGWKDTPPNTQLTVSDGAANDSFGVSAVISGTTPVAGAPESDAPGEAYVFGHGPFLTIEKPSFARDNPGNYPVNSLGHFGLCN
jgi:hypothetical protein